MEATARHFDTLGAAEELEAVGLTHEQAKAISLVVDRGRDNGKLAMEMETMRAELKEEIAALRAEMREEIAALRAEMREEIAALRAELKTEFNQEIAALRSDIAVLKAQVRYIFWVLGFQSAVLLAIALKVFQ